MWDANVAKSVYDQAEALEQSMLIQFHVTVRVPALVPQPTIGFVLALNIISERQESVSTMTIGRHR